MSTDQIIDHDSWNYSPAKLPQQSKITLGRIQGVNWHARLHPVLG